MTKGSIFIGRFQPFHNGHRYVIKKCPTKKLYIGIGSSQYHHTLVNPFTFDERKEMIILALSSQVDLTYEIYAIPDIHDPPRWVAHVESIVPPFSKVLTNNDFTAKLFKTKGYTVEKPGLYERDECMGQQIRNRMIENHAWHHLVPKEIISYLSKINAEKRLQQIAHSDE